MIFKGIFTMVMHQIASQNFQLYACLPFVELAHESMIQFGPVVFWSASKAEEYLHESFNTSFQDYIRIVGQIKARSNGQEKQFVNTVTLNPKATTCVSIAEGVPSEILEFFLLILYIFYILPVHSAIFIMDKKYLLLMPFAK